MKKKLYKRLTYDERDQIPYKFGGRKFKPEITPEGFGQPQVDGVKK